MVNWDNFEKFFSTGVPSAVLFSSFLVVGLVIVGGLMWKRVDRKNRFILFVLIIEYAFIVICSTIVFRPVITSGFEKLQLAPFWTYKAILAHTIGVSVWDIVLNMALFLPLGFLLKLLYPSLPFTRLLFIAVVCSLCIETSQYVFVKGIAQFDDVMHNTIGAAIGCGLAALVLRIWNTMT